MIIRGGDRRKYKLIDDGGWPLLKGTSFYIPVPVIQDSLTCDVCGDQLGTYIIILGIENVLPCPLNALSQILRYHWDYQSPMHHKHDRDSKAMSK